VGNEVCFHEKFFEFNVLITEDPFSAKRLLEKFAQFLAGWGSPAGSQLRILSVAYHGPVRRARSEVPPHRLG
jgi:thiazole synthase ThiGH ThiG subunit